MVRSLLFLVLAIVAIWLIAGLAGLEFSLWWTLALSIVLTLAFNLVTRATRAR